MMTACWFIGWLHGSPCSQSSLPTPSAAAKALPGLPWRGLGNDSGSLTVRWSQEDKETQSSQSHSALPCFATIAAVRCLPNWLDGCIKIVPQRDSDRKLGKASDVCGYPQSIWIFFTILPPHVLFSPLQDTHLHTHTFEDLNGVYTLVRDFGPYPFLPTHQTFVSSPRARKTALISCCAIAMLFRYLSYKLSILHVPSKMLLEHQTHHFSFKLSQ